MNRAKRLAIYIRYNHSKKGQARRRRYTRKPGTKMYRRMLDARPDQVLRRRLNNQGNP